MDVALESVIFESRRVIFESLPPPTLLASGPLPTCSATKCPLLPPPLLPVDAAAPTDAVPDGGAESLALDNDADDDGVTDAVCLDGSTTRRQSSSGHAGVPAHALRYSRLRCTRWSSNAAAAATQPAHGANATRTHAAHKDDAADDEDEAVVADEAPRSQSLSSVHLPVSDEDDDAASDSSAPLTLASDMAPVPC